MSSSPSDDGPPGDFEQSFVSHLVELRDRLLYAIYGVVAVLIVLAIFPGPARLVDFMVYPIQAHLPKGASLIAVGVLAPVVVPLKILFLSALILALPWVLYQAWQFVAPGLYQHEKRLALPVIVSGYVLFLAGAAFVHFLVLGQMFHFIQNFAPTMIAVTPDISSYAETVLSLYLVFGLAFQVPVVIVLLVRFDVVTIEQLKDWRGYYIVGAAVCAAMVTPPDLVSMLALLGPMILLYEVGTVAARLYRRFTVAPEADATADGSAAAAAADAAPKADGAAQSAKDAAAPGNNKAA
jgi:sec-independent protein translocase protein TatC